MWEVGRVLSRGLEIPVGGNSCEEREKEGRAGDRGRVPWASSGGVWQTLLPPSRGGLEAANKPPTQAGEPSREPWSAPGMGTASQSCMALYVF